MPRGVLCPVVTPFARGVAGTQPLDLAGFRANLARVLAGECSGAVVMGSTGEFPALTAEEKRILIDEACSQRAASKQPDKALVIGVGNEGCERDVLSLTRAAHRAGCDAVLLLPPHYFPQLSLAHLVTAFYRRIADASPLPVIIYNIPKCVGFDLADETVAALSRHGNIVGLKDSSGSAEGMARLLRHQHDRFAVLTGSAARLLADARLGARGAVLAVSNVAPELCSTVLRHGDEEAQRRLTGLHNALQDKEGSQIALIKAALDWKGFAGGQCRDPLRREADPDEVLSMKRQLTQLNI